MRRLTTQSFLGATLVIGILAGAPELQAFMTQLEVLWDDTNPVPPGDCRQFLVKAWPERLYRGRTSPHECLVNAIRDYRHGDHEEAIGWLQAALCPDREAQQRVMRHAATILRDLLATFGPLVP